MESRYIFEEHSEGYSPIPESTAKVAEGENDGVRKIVISWSDKPVDSDTALEHV